MSRYNPVRTDDGIEIRDDDGEVIVTSKTWPPREPADLDALFDDGNISNPTKELLMLLFGVTDVSNEQS